MEDNYWINFWTNYSVSSKGRNEHARVLRTLNKQPVTSDQWQNSVDHIKASLNIDAEDNLLDLCCGNGLIAKELAPLCSEVTAVDISEELLNEINTVEYPNIKTICGDIRQLNL